MNTWLTIQILVVDMTSGILSIKYYKINETTFIKFYRNAILKASNGLPEGLTK